MTALMLGSANAAFDVPTADGCRLVVRRYGNQSKPRLLVTHGNGFAVDGYWPFWRHFLADFDVVVFDFRNHGRSDRSDPSRHVYSQLVDDLARVRSAVDAELGAKPTAGIFHSMSARTAMKHAIEVGWTWDALILFDPPDVPPPGHAQYDRMRVFEDKLVQYALARPRRFASPLALAELYRGSRGAQNWVAEAFDLMANAVLREELPDDPGAGAGLPWHLVCAPEIEAGIYAEAMTLDLWPEARLFGGPVKLVGADPTMKGAPASAAANYALGTENGYDYDFVQGCGHLLQIEKPAACVELVKQHLARSGFVR